MPTEPLRYKKPPVVERALVVHAAVQEETFQVKAEEWRAAVQSDFPRAEVMSEWTLAVTEKDGMPALDPSRQTITLRQTFWKMAGNKKDHGIQLWPDKISLNLLGAAGNPRDFKELDELANRWLSRWATHFGISQCTGVTLQYVNLLSEETLPKFAEKKSLKIGEALKMFQGFPNPSAGLLVPPFDFQINLDPKTTPPSRVGAHCVSIAPSRSDKPAMHLRFTATTHIGDSHKIPIEKVSEEVRQMHDLIIQHFQSYFTDEAKKSFEPICHP
jgi:hypothetical protein